MPEVRRLSNYLTRIKALSRKELRQILRDRELLFMLVIMPVLQITLYSLALSPEVDHLRLGIVDYANTPLSRELTASLTANQIFDVTKSGGSLKSLSHAVQGGKLDAGLVIPPDFTREIKANRGAEVQVFLDGVDANTSGIASGYIAQTIDAFDKTTLAENKELKPKIAPEITFAYNPGLESRWFFIPGVMALVLNLVSTLVSSAAVVREKDTGTLEQLLMTPVSSFQILAAKVIPLSIVLMTNVLISLIIAVFIYGIPFRGNILLFLAVSFLSVIVGISMGIALAAFAANQRQSLLTSFFVNLPVIQLSGALSPVESMPEIWQFISLFDPLRYYVSCVRAIMLKGSGLDAIWPNVLALIVFAVALLAASSSRFRKQLK